jgi:hypothetical protein
MTTLAQFTTPDEVRAVLGVAPEELRDEVLAMPMYLRQLQFALSDIDGTLESTYLTIAALASRTTAQQRLYDVMQVYAPYAVAKTLLTSVALFAPRRITDGRAETERVVDPFEDVREGVDAGLISLKDRLVSALAGVGTTVTTVTRVVTFSTSTGLAVNPVTNE